MTRFVGPARAVASVTGNAPVILSYRARTVRCGGLPEAGWCGALWIGRWTEVYLLPGGTWLLIPVHAGADTG